MSPIPVTPREVMFHQPLLQRAWAQRVLPIATSLTLHLGIVVFALVAYRAVQTIREPAGREQVTVPTAVISGKEPGGLPNPGLGADPNRQTKQDQIADAHATDGWTTQTSPTLSTSMLNDESGKQANRIGVGPMTAVNTNGLRNGSGTPGGVAPFGPPDGGQGIGPKAPFFNNGDVPGAYRVAYICDGSGSMLALRGLLAQELRKSIDVLKPMQAFNVIIFQNAQPLAVDDKTLLIANGNNKRRAFEFLEKLPASGQTNPIPALELAIKQKPQLIYLLTDGQFDNVRSYAEVLDFLRTANRDKSIRINTILLQSGEPGDTLDVADQQAADTLKLIAKENGGVYDRVSSSSVR